MMADEPTITKIEEWHEVHMEWLQHTMAFLPGDDVDYRLRQRKFDGIFTAALTEHGELRVYISPAMPPDGATAYRMFANDYWVVLIPAYTPARPIVWDRHATRFFERTVVR